MGRALFIARSCILLVSCHSVADLSQQTVSVRQPLLKASVVWQGDEIGKDCSRDLGALGGGLQAKPAKLCINSSTVNGGQESALPD
jgi:hypothetical protein